MSNMVYLFQKNIVQTFISKYDSSFCSNEIFYLSKISYLFFYLSKISYLVNKRIGVPTPIGKEIVWSLG